MNTEALAKIQQVALYLGYPWKFNHLHESSWSFEIIDGTGRGLHLRPDRDKLRISCLFPRDKTCPMSTDYQSIGVSLSRPAKDIAADIKRRLLPHYIAAYEKAAHAYQQRKAQEDTLELMAQALCRVSGGSEISYGRTAKTIGFEGSTAELWTSEHVTLHLNRLTIDQAIRIIGFLKSESGA